MGKVGGGKGVEKEEKIQTRTKIKFIPLSSIPRAGYLKGNWFSFEFQRMCLPLMISNQSSKKAA